MLRWGVKAAVEYFTLLSAKVFSPGSAKFIVSTVTYFPPLWIHSQYSMLSLSWLQSIVVHLHLQICTHFPLHHHFYYCMCVKNLYSNSAILVISTPGSRLTDVWFSCAVAWHFLTTELLDLAESLNSRKNPAFPFSGGRMMEVKRGGKKKEYHQFSLIKAGGHHTGLYFLDLYWWAHLIGCNPGGGRSPSRVQPFRAMPRKRGEDIQTDGFNQSRARVALGLFFFFLLLNILCESFFDFA